MFSGTCAVSIEIGTLADVHKPRQFFLSLRLLGAVTALFAVSLPLSGCRHRDFPDFAANYREYAFVSNGASNSVSVLDLVNLRQDRTLQVGEQPTGLAVNPRRNEVYAVNTRSGSVSVIDAENLRVVATIPVHREPYSISVDSAGRRAYVANSGSDSVSVLDLVSRREIATAATGSGPGLAVISPDLRSLAVTNRRSGSVSIYETGDAPALKLRATFPGCADATHAVILQDSSKVFVACSGSHQVMVVGLASEPGSWAARQDPASMKDHLLALLDVGAAPVHIALKPDGGEVFVSNFGSDSISEISTWTNEVSGTYTIGSKPVRGVISRDNSDLWVANFGADLVSLYSIDDGHVITTVHTGSAPDGLAFSAAEHLLLAVDSHSGDVAVIRTQGRQGAALFTMLPSGNDPHDIVVKSFLAN